MNITTNFGRRLALLPSNSNRISARSSSRRKWLAGLAFGALLAVNAPTSAEAQIPRMISYQGLIQNNGVPMNGTVTLTINYYSVGTTTPIFTETFAQVPIVNGIYNIELGSIGGGFPLTMSFNQPIEIGIQVNNSDELRPRIPFAAAPYALNAYSLNGIPSSPTPLAGTIFPLPLDDFGKIAPNLLPDIVAGQNITITRDSLNQFVINGAGSTGNIRSIIAGSGLQGGGSSGDVTLSLAPGGIQGSQIARGSITGGLLDPHIAGIGLYQDVVGNLNVGVDSSAFIFRNNQLTLRSGMPVVGGSGSFTTLTSSDNSTIGAGTAATSNSFGTGGNANGVMNIIGSTGAGSTTRINGGVFFTGSIDAGGNRITNLGAPINANDVATRAYADSAAVRAVPIMGGDVTGASGNNVFNPTNTGVGNRVITGINNGTTQINGSRVNTNFGTQPVTGGSATFATLNVSGNTTIATAPGSVTAIGNTTGSTAFTGPVTFNGTFDAGTNRLQNLGAPINPNDAATRAYADSASSRSTVLGGDLSGTTGNAQLNPAATGVGNRLISGVNNGTTLINGARITPNFGTQAVTGGAASFTTLTSSGLTTLATGGANVGIGTTTPNALLDVLSNSASEQLARFYNTGAGASAVRIVGGANALTALELSDANQYISSITSTAANGLMFNVAPAGTLSESAMNGATKLAIDRLGNVLFTANSVAFNGSRLQSVGTPTVGTDAATKSYVDNSAASTSAMAGDVTGTTGNNTLATTSATGNREIAGINNGTTQIDGARVNAWSLTGNAGTTPANFVGTTDAQPLSIRTNNVQREIYRADGTIAFGNTAPAYTSNAVEVDMQNVGGAILTGEQNQGMNVLGTTQAGAALSIALRGRLTASNAVTEMRGVSGASDVMAGSTVGTNTPGSGGGALGGYFNADIKTGGAIGAYAVLTGVAADAENTGAGTTANTNAFVGGRFGANSANFGASTAVGTLAQAGGSTTNNMGVLASAGANAADLGALAATIPVGSNTGLYGFVPTSANGVNTSAIVANNATATGTALNVVSGGVRSSAAVGSRFADNVLANGGGTATVISNSLVKPTSTIIVSLESATGTGNVYISSKGAGTFTVNTSGTYALTDRIDYIIINP